MTPVMNFFAYEALGTGVGKGFRAQTEIQTLAALQHAAIPTRSINHNTTTNEMLNHVSLIPVTHHKSANTPLIRADLVHVLIRSSALSSVPPFKQCI
jgi:hypothetical protein